MGFFIVLFIAISLLNNTGGDGMATLLAGLFFVSLLGKA
tara:strand:- start:7752 stop:7868 length:117 start_codon:yes stop_codon:yes gene_type:complete